MGLKPTQWLVISAIYVVICAGSWLPLLWVGGGTVYTVLATVGGFAALHAALALGTATFFLWRARTRWNTLSNVGKTMRLAIISLVVFTVLGLASLGVAIWSVTQPRTVVVAPSQMAEVDEPLTTELISGEGTKDPLGCTGRYTSSQGETVEEVVTVPEGGKGALEVVLGDRGVWDFTLVCETSDGTNVFFETGEVLVTESG